MIQILKSGLIAAILLSLISCTSIKEVVGGGDRTIPDYILVSPVKPIIPEPPRNNGEMHLYRKQLEQYGCRLEAWASDIVRYATRGEQTIE